jgi:FixJ family two-component response regulator
MNPADSNIFLVDSDPTHGPRLGVLAASLNLKCCAFSNAEEYLRQFDPAQPGCVVAELCQPGMSGFELQECLAARGAQIPIVFCSAAADVASAVRAMRLGAVTVLKKPYRDEEMVQALQLAIEKDSAGRTNRAKHAEMRYRFDQLHDRERETLQLILAGLPNKTIARKLGVSRRTVERIRAAAFEKLGAESALDVVRIVEGVGDHHLFMAHTHPV